MSVLEALHQQHKARIRRIAAAVYKPPPPPPPVETERARKMRELIAKSKARFADEAAWQLAIAGDVLPEAPSKSVQTSIPIKRIQSVICEHYGISMLDLVSPRRTKHLVRPRHVGYYLCRHLTSRSFPEIGRQFGDRDHTTILLCVRKITRQIETDADLCATVEILTKKLGCG